MASFVFVCGSGHPMVGYNSDAGCPVCLARLQESASAALDIAALRSVLRSDVFSSRYETRIEYRAALASFLPPVNPVPRRSHFSPRPPFPPDSGNSGKN